jgi:hypothetical protein
MTCGVQRSLLNIEAYMVPPCRAFVASSYYSSKEMAEFHKCRYGGATEVAKMNACRTSGHNKTKRNSGIKNWTRKSRDIHTGLQQLQQSSYTRTRQVDELSGDASELCPVTSGCNFQTARITYFCEI